MVKKINSLSAGFSLIELLVVLMVISIILGVILVSFRGSRAVSRDTERKTELEEIRSALETYRSDNNSYPDSLSSLSSDYVADETLEDPLPSSYNYEYQKDDDTYSLCCYLETEDHSPFGCGGDCGDTCSYKLTNP